MSKGQVRPFDPDTDTDRDPDPSPLFPVHRLAPTPASSRDALHSARRWAMRSRAGAHGRRFPLLQETVYILKEIVEIRLYGVPHNSIVNAVVSMN